ncbi:hypothetical protein DL96DRAFT_190440 [Flagelloscypha sp. PMI_526]|nr:hypothetical protein DL96DRAFT_190440 [Flagelloscypha sp. PMI_526]
MFIFDSAVFILTLVKGYRRMDFTRGIGVTIMMPLTRVMMRDGALYFLAIIVANAANVATFYLHSHRLRGSLSTFASSISVTLASRIMLNLHKKYTSQTMPSIGMAPLESKMQFQTVTTECGHS